MNRDNPLNVMVEAFWTLPFLAACAWSQWLDNVSEFLDELDSTR